ncbi:MAG: hypothetical protein JSV78_05500 [Phycisphaerales bacterium]|nr:MAG: hypothetical protein JSV78_05500 [Phycisphaerales bacterium]
MRKRKRPRRRRYESPLPRFDGDFFDLWCTLFVLLILEPVPELLRWFWDLITDSPRDRKPP